MRYIIVPVATLLVTTGCSTLDQSLRLGASAGSLFGAAPTYSAETSACRSPSLESVGLGASVGMAVGLITSYFVHDSVSRDRTEADHETEVYFGDLPPSPFVIPNIPKKGKR